MTSDDPVENGPYDKGYSAEEISALNGLIAGDLEPLADLLEFGDGRLHPSLQRRLVTLIRGSSKETDFRLVAAKHPDLKHVSHGPRAKRLASLTTMATAIKVMRAGGFEEGQTEAAFSTVARDTGLSRASVIKHWVKHKETLKLFRAHGLFGK